jgi:hypothetical protein
VKLFFNTITPAVFLFFLGLPIQAIGQTTVTAKPKSNFISRAKLLAANELSVTISHSKAGQTNAFEFAVAHCGKFGKLAVVQSSSSQIADNITTWACVAPPQASTKNIEDTQDLSKQ